MASLIQIQCVFYCILFHRLLSHYLASRPTWIQWYICLCFCILYVTFIPVFACSTFYLYKYNVYVAVFCFTVCCLTIGPQSWPEPIVCETYSSAGDRQLARSFGLFPLSCPRSTQTFVPFISCYRHHQTKMDNRSLCSLSLSLVFLRCPGKLLSKYLGNE